jgi:hypothetical protein
VNYCIFREKEEEFEDEHEEAAKGKYFNNCQDIILNLQKYGEDQPLGTQLLLSALLQFPRLQFKDDSIDEYRISYDSEKGGVEIIKCHVSYVYNK